MDDLTSENLVDAPSHELDESGGDPKKERERSTIKFPTVDLDTALDFARSIYANYGNSCTVDQLAAKTGHKETRKGGFPRKIAGAQIFGVVTRDRDIVALTDLGKEAVNEEGVGPGRVKAFLNVELYRRVYEEFKGRTLPSDAGLQNVFVQCGVVESQAEYARQTFRRSADQAGFFAHGKDRLVEPAVQKTVVNTRVESFENDTGDNSLELRVRVLEDQIREKDRELAEARSRGPSLSLDLPMPVTGFLMGLPTRQGQIWSESDLTNWLSAFKTVLEFEFREKIKKSTSS